MSQSFTKRMIASFLRDTNPVRAMSLTRLFEAPFQVNEVHLNAYETYTAITLEEQVMIYPTVVVHHLPDNPITIIDIE